MSARNLAVVRPETPDEQFAYYLSNLDDDKLGCKAEGRHRMPRLKPGNLAKNIEVRRLAGGFYDIHATCSECGIPGVLTTDKGGTLDGTETWQYDYSSLPGYLAPPGTGRSRRREYRAENGDRVVTDIRKAAAATTARLRAEAAARAAKTPKKHIGGKPHVSNPKAQRHAREGEKLVEQDWQRQHPGGDTA